MKYNEGRLNDSTAVPPVARLAPTELGLRANGGARPLPAKYRDAFGDFWTALPQKIGVIHSNCRNTVRKLQTHRRLAPAYSLATTAESPVTTSASNVRVLPIH